MNESKYPLYFVVERVSNGYIVSTKDGTSSEIKKEIVPADNAHECIRKYIGELISVESLMVGKVARYHVDCLNLVKGTNTDSKENFASEDPFFEALMLFYKARCADFKDGHPLAIVEKGGESIEIYGKAAEEVAKRPTLQIPISKKNGYFFLSFPNNAEGMKCLSQNIPGIHLLDYTKEAVMEWYEKNKKK